MGNKQQALRILLAFVNLARVRIACMVLVACSIGFLLAYRGQFDLCKLLFTLLGTALLSSGSSALNCYIERDWDALMPRTSRRPLPAGTIAPTSALVFGLFLILAGGVILFCQINALAGWLGMAAVMSYVAIYTPAKRFTWLNTSIGSIPGAIPPLIGWAAAKGQIDAGGWILFAILFVWQHTHFLPIAWLYKDDYEKAGFRMLPVLEPDGAKTFGLTALTALVLLPISMLLYGLDFVGLAYMVASILFGVLLIVAGFRWWRQPSRGAARAVLLLSLVYLPAVLGAVVVDRYAANFGSHLHQWLEVAWRWT